MFHNSNQPQAPAHVLALALVGGYLIYMAVKMISNVQTGSSSMSMTTAGILAGIMGLAGAAVLGYGMYLGAKAANQKKSDENPKEEK